MDADTESATRVLTELRAFGPYFTVTVRDEPPADGGWRPVVELYDAGSSGLSGLLQVTLDRLDTRDRRVAGSILHQGYAARLWSVALGAALDGGIVVGLPAASLFWRSTGDSLVELLAVAPTGTRVPTEPTGEVARRVHAAVLDDHVHRLACAVRGATGISGTVLAGNAASALVGTLRVLAGSELDGPARQLAGALLAGPSLRGTGAADLTGSPPSFRRASCCLFYRVPGGGLCGDCILTEPPT